MWRKIKWGGKKLEAFFSVQRTGCETTTSDRATADEMSPSPPPPPTPFHWTQTNTKNTDIHTQKLHFGVQSADCWHRALLMWTERNVALYASVWERVQLCPSVIRQMRGNRVQHTIFKIMLTTFISKCKTQCNAKCVIMCASFVPGPTGARNKAASSMIAWLKFAAHFYALHRPIKISNNMLISM